MSDFRKEAAAGLFRAFKQGLTSQARNIGPAVSRRLAAFRAAPLKETKAHLVRNKWPYGLSVGLGLMSARTPKPPES